jgi:hypothetical protein
MRPMHRGCAVMNIHGAVAGQQVSAAGKQHINLSSEQISELHDDCWATAEKGSQDAAKKAVEIAFPVMKKNGAWRCLRRVLFAVALLDARRK